MGAFAIARIEVPSIGGSRIERTSSADGSISSAVERTAAFIPSEILTLYVAALALADTTSNGLNWVITAACAILAPLAVVVAHVERGKAVNEDLARAGMAPRSFQISRWPIVAAFFSFILWALILPDSVAASLDFYNRRAALVLLLVGECLIGMVDRVLGGGSDLNVA